MMVTVSDARDDDKRVEEQVMRNGTYCRHQGECDKISVTPPHAQPLTLPLPPTFPV